MLLLPTGARTAGAQIVADSEARVHVEADSAVAHYRKALALAVEAGDRDGQLMALANMGVIYTEFGERDSALVYYRRLLPLARATGDRVAVATTLNTIGEANSAIGRQDSALIYFHEALALWPVAGSGSGEVSTLVNIAFTYEKLGRPDSSLAYDRRALRLSRARGDQPYEALTLAAIGAIFSHTSQPDSALLYYRQTLPLWHAIGSASGEATTLGNIGEVYHEIGQPDSALAYFRQAAGLERRAGNRLGEASMLNNIGAVYAETGREDSALDYYHRALPIFHDRGDRIGEASTLDNIAVIYDRFGLPDSALTYLRRVLRLSSAAGNLLAEAKARNNIGVVLAELGQSDTALAYFRQALLIERSIADRSGEASTLNSIAAIYRDAGQLDSALKYLDLSAALMVGNSRMVGSDFNRLSYNETQNYLYEYWTLTWLSLARPARGGNARGPAMDTTAAAYGALAASERGRARALLDLMRDTTARIEPGADLPAEGARLARSLQRAHAAGLVYTYAGNALITWLLSSEGTVTVYRRAISRDTLATRIRELRGSLGVDKARTVEVEGDTTRTTGAGDPAAWRRNAAALAAILLPPQLLWQLGAERELVIVPQGPIALVPFAALPAGADGTPFGATRAIRYVPSLATLDQVEARPGLATGPARNAALRRSLVVGNPTMPRVTASNGRRDRLSPLPGAETESREIAAQLGTQALTGPAGTEATVVQRLPGAPVVHLATHGFAYSSEAKARDSFVALAADSVNDGLLTVGMILDTPTLQLTADLVVLSACQTGLGDLKQAEGTVGLQRAFLARGARSVLVSLWNVSDVSTRALMTSYYKHWLSDTDHPDKAESLRRAQNDVRSTKGWEDPRYWAAFQLVGAQ